MKLPTPIPVKELAVTIGATLLGDDSLLVTGINEIHLVEAGDITFVDVEKYYNKALNSKATIVLINKETDCPEGKCLLVCDNPFEAYNNLVWQYRPFAPLPRLHQSEPLLNETEEITPDTLHRTIHPTAVIEPGVVIGHHVHIGANTYIQANAYIGDYTHIGEHVIIHAGALLGTDAFYFKKTEAGYQRWRSGGRVIIEDRAEIGAGTTINKGVSGDTVIGEGTKIDSQVHIGHDTRIGKNCLLAAQVGISGNCIIEDGVILYGQAGVAQNVRIGAKAIISAKAGVSKDLEGGKMYFGVPAEEARTVYRELAALRHLPKFFTDFYK